MSNRIINYLPDSFVEESLLALKVDKKAERYYKGKQFPSIDAAIEKLSNIKAKRDKAKEATHGDVPVKYYNITEEQLSYLVNKVLSEYLN